MKLVIECLVKLCGTFRHLLLRCLSSNMLSRLKCGLCVMTFFNILIDYFYKSKRFIAEDQL